MSTKQIVLTSAGLQNIVLTKYQDDEDFVFVFGEQEFSTKSFFAEFISPVVSRLHKTDPTIHRFNFSELNKNSGQDFKNFCRSVMTPEIISLFQQISSGHSIEINEEEAIKLRFISIFLGNEELHDKLNEHFPPNYSESNVNSYLKNIECCYNFSQLKAEFDIKSLISFVSSHFDDLNRDDFLKVPRKIQYEIVSHKNLRIESEDSLFDIVTEIIERGKEKEEISDVMFLEQIEFTELSEDRLHSFVDFFDSSEMSTTLWNKLSKCLFNQTERKRKTVTTTKIIVGGDDEFNLLGEKPNNKSDDGYPAISPPLNLSLGPSSLLSYSIYSEHSILVTKSGSLLGIGNNKCGQITNSLLKAQINQFTEFSIKDDSGHQLAPISAVYSAWSTLYMFSKSRGRGKQLVYCDKDIRGGDPVFLDIGDEEPVSLFGGCENVAAINNKGEIFFINRSAVEKSTSSRIEAVSLPDGEKASSVACLNGLVVVLSSNGRVFSSSIDPKNSIKFAPVSELSGYKIIWVSGTWEHCLAVSKEGLVFGWGSNKFGQLGIGEETESVSSFTEISSLSGYKIRAAYAGYNHSLFETREGKILSCGSNDYGELLLSSGPSIEYVYSPRETTITGGAAFCIAGAGLSSVFIGDPPKNTPNMPIRHHQ